ncbi:MAG: large subunit ribosomal protein L24 [Gammaproteobacteria bacterium]|jgi:large subunit ribosomal protein L24
MNKILKNDEIIVLAGKDKGKTGSVIQIFANGKALVNDVNVVKKHVRGNPQTGVTGGIIPKEMPIQISNIALVNPATGKADRVGIKTLDDGRKVRFFKSNGETVDSK